MVDKEIIRSMAKLFVFVAVAKLAGFLREASIAGYFGVSSETDLFYYTLNLCLLPAALWLALANSYLVPTFLGLDGENKPHFLRKMATVSLVFAIVATLLIGSILIVLANFGVTPGGLSLFLQSKWMIALLLLCIPLGCLIAYMSSVMLANGWHANTLYESIPAFVVVVLLFLFAPPGLLILGVAYCVGMLLHSSALALNLKKRSAFFLPSTGQRDGLNIRMRDAMLILFLSQLIISMASLVDQFFAVDFESGLLAEMTFANKITALVIGLSSLVISRALLPIFGRLVGSNWALCYRTAIKWSIGLVLLSGVAVAIVAVLSDLLVKIVFERGSFNAEMTASVASLLRSSLIQVPFFVGGIVLVSLLTSLKLYKQLLVTSIVALVVKLSFNTALLSVFGRHTMMLSWTAVYALNFFLIFFFLWRFNESHEE